MREVVLAEPALADLLDINDYYLVEVSDRVAGKIIDGLEAAVNNLAEFPDRGGIPKELLSLGIRQYRQVIEKKPYRIIYETLADKIVVHAILDGRRDMQTLLMQRIFRV
ncbi:MAG: type II toxin-antitoxin system RelE/ParE family toxin [Methylobacter sp.]|jgi:toxin ParE1/3/4|uniref:type II toxin-antitoxin system RelE/ParE family toxin n=1 Tax=Methylobacter sp. TaxID=2051955 RepID=UPI0025EC2862|nr:type II toxin-antitoxin system RelE/ParE family toxin [Methylobacter sp.]MCK9622386.1 type II toxin-antitoxin system RelE/ParE family toxin [Methylobacter sp.]